jgi:hypothetical protein
MRVLIDVADGADSGDLAEFHGWLKETRAVTRGAKVSLEPRGGNGTMSADGVIALAVSAVSALSAAVQSYAAWRSSRPSAPSLTVTVGGRVVVVNLGSPEESAAILEAASQSPAEERP